MILKNLKKYLKSDTAQMLILNTNQIYKGEIKNNHQVFVNSNNNNINK